MSALRLYSFVNFYLSSIQQGIQTQHAAQELTNKYIFSDQMYGGYQVPILKDWSMNHKTTVVLNGGDNQGVDEICHLIEEVDGLGNPFACFFEDDGSLGGIMTSCAIVLPEEIFDAKNYSAMLATRRSDISRTKFSADYPREQYSGSWFWEDKDSPLVKVYNYNTPEARFLTVMKFCPLAR